VFPDFAQQRVEIGSMELSWMFDVTNWFVDITHWTDILQVVHWHLPMDLAQQFKEPDFAGDIGKAWNTFVKTGQVWAFLVGLIMGYIARTFTSFG
jgi:hypothetical protein